MATDGAGGVGLAAAAGPDGLPEDDTPPRPGRRFRPDPVLVVAALLVLVPTLVAMGSALRNPWAPTNDWALLELQVRQVGTAHTPLLGAWSRFGWRHPGPLPFYLMALPYRLAAPEHGLLFAAGVVNFLATLGCVAVAVRHPRLRALTLLAGLAVLERGLGISQLGDPWNPTLPIVPFALFVLLCLELVLGPRRWTLPALVGVASFVVQAHVGFAQPVAAIGAATAALWWLEHRRLPAWRRLVPAAAVAGLAWLPVAFDEVVRTGNLSTIVRWSSGASVAPGMGRLTEGTMTAHRAVGALAWLVDPTGLWIGNVTPINAFGYPLLGQSSRLLLVVVAAMLAAALVLARRAPLADGYGRAVRAAAGLAAAGLAATATDLLTARGLPVFWPFRWVAVVTMTVFVALGFAVAGVAARRVPALDDPAWRPRPGAGGRRGLAAAGAALALVAVPVAATVWGGSLGHQPEEAQSHALLRLVPAIERAGRGQPFVVANSTAMLSTVDLGLPVILERAGIPWVDITDRRAAGHPQLSLAPAAALDGLTGYAIDTGQAELLARSGPPRRGEPRDSELILVRRTAPPAPPADD